jgi:hypothetical protein
MNDLKVKMNPTELLGLDSDKDSSRRDQPKGLLDFDPYEIKEEQKIP